jgi:hypothetical protein
MDGRAREYTESSDRCSLYSKDPIHTNALQCIIVLLPAIQTGSTVVDVDDNMLHHRWHNFFADIDSLYGGKIVREQRACRALANPSAADDSYEPFQVE